MRAVEFVHGDDGGRATAVAIAQEAFEDWRAVSSCPRTEARSSTVRPSGRRANRMVTMEASAIFSPPRVRPSIENNIL